MQLEELTNDYLKLCETERKLDAKTIRAYRTDLMQYLVWLEGRDDISDTLSRETVRAYLVHLNAHYAPASTRRKMATLRAFMSFLQNERRIITNPFDGLRLRMREPKRLPRTVSISDMTQLFRHMTGTGENQPRGGELQVARDRATFELLVATGIRVSELCALNVGDVDFEGKTVRVAGKGNKERVVQLEDARTLEAVNRYLKLRKSYGTCGPDDPLILNRVGSRATDHAIRDILIRRCEEAGIERHITPHMFRHTFATWLLEQDVDIRYIQKLLGHSSLRTTEIYTYVGSAKLREIMRENNPRGIIDA